MKIELENAIKVFHPNPSYEQVYFEAVANSLDANANEITINISIESFDKPKSLEVIIQDNGDGFTDKNFSKFSKLLKVDNAAHKGLGRLVYLAYFSRIEIESIFEEWKRSFVFNSDFDEENQAFKKTRMKNNSLRQTILKFSGYFKEKVYTYDFLNPQKIKESLLRQFFPLFFSIKESGRDIKFSIELKVDFSSLENNFYSQSCEFSLKDLPELKKQIFKIPQVDLIQSFDTYYSIEKNIAYSKSLYTAVCVDNRAIPYELISIDAIPDGYQVRFLFMSEYFIGKTNTSRQKIDLPDEMTERQLREYFRQQMGKIIEEEIPDIAKKNGRLRSEINKNYPHLDGYISDENVGLIQKSTVLEEAQKKFFNDQRTVLDCEHLNEDQYFKALELSSRTLAEYVIYRARIISKLKTMTLNNSEKEIHELIVPTKTTLRQEKFDYDIFNNNVWMLDDKYMSYNVILSDQQMKKIIHEISIDTLEDESRPDITLIFSADPSQADKVNVVVVELKKYGLPLKKNEEVITQLRQRAQKLLRYYPNKIERIWFYGITDIDSDFRRSLIENEFKELFSCGQMFYKYQKIIVEDENNPFYVDLFVLTYNALVNDAEIRNETFLKILRSSIQKCVQEKKLGQI